MKALRKCTECAGEVVIKPRVVFEFTIPHTRIELSLIRWDNLEEQYCPTCMYEEEKKLVAHLLGD